MYFPQTPSHLQRPWKEGNTGRQSLIKNLNRSDNLMGKGRAFGSRLSDPVNTTQTKQGDKLHQCSVYIGNDLQRRPARLVSSSRGLVRVLMSLGKDPVVLGSADYLVWEQHASERLEGHGRTVSWFLFTA